MSALHAYFEETSRRDDVASSVTILLTTKGVEVKVINITPENAPVFARAIEQIIERLRAIADPG